LIFLLIAELGGKSPVYVDEDLDPNFLEVTARRIVWGRFSNAGQTCIAPDYVLTRKSMMKPLTQAFQKALLEFFGSDPQKSDSYGRIVSPARFRALNNLLKGQEKRVVIGGQVDEKELYIAPTVLEDVDRTDAVMQEEIFGPILPLVAVESMKDAIDFINNGDKPLALYVFSNDKLVCKHFMENTTSGGAISNDVLMHCAVPELPFGGVGESGMGAYHGKFTFDQFSHQRAVMMKDTSMESVMSLRYPPYTATKLKWLLWVAGKVFCLYSFIPLHCI
jgi:acyl-CoA reductase-like NAD-dependent aldehyde dehydrogenase